MAATTITIQYWIEQSVLCASGLQYACERFTDELTSRVDEGIREVDSIKNSDVRSDWRIRSACQDFTDAVGYAYEYVDKVDDVFYYGQREAEDVKIALRQGNITAFYSFMDTMKGRLVEVERMYQAFTGANWRAVRSSVTAAESCKKKATEERKKKNTTRAVGGTLATGAVVVGTAGGVAASVIAGVFTLGIGAVIGLTVTAIGSTAAGAAIGAGTAVATYVIADEYENSERNLRSLSTSFNSLERTACNMEKSAVKVKDNLSALADGEIKAYQVRVCIIDEIQISLKNLSNKTANCRTRAKRAKEAFEGVTRGVQ